MIGGVIEYHPYLRNLLEDKTGRKIVVPDDPQLVNSYGAALMARANSEILIHKNNQ